MRLLIDVHGLPWSEAWKITVGTFSYTNHTLLPEALETWPVHLFERVLPRHLQIIYRINAEHIEAAKEKDPEGFTERLPAISLIDEHGDRKLRMGHLAFVGSHHVNGVSALHTGLMRETVFRDLHAIYPDRIVNKTNGVTFRRWLLQANPALVKVLRDVCGDAVLDDPSLDCQACRQGRRFRRAGAYRGRQAREQGGARHGWSATAWASVSTPMRCSTCRSSASTNTSASCSTSWRRSRPISPSATSRSRHWVPRVKIFAGKAAASYTQAKLIIKLINDVAKVVNSDPITRDLLRVVFLPDYNVSLAETIIPAADLSEQISTAGMEASGTGNMKLALNGALTIGTLDGANVEIREHVGPDNIFIFGLKAHEVEERRAPGPRRQRRHRRHPRCWQRVIDAIDAGIFWPGEGGLFTPLMHALAASRLLHDHAPTSTTTSPPSAASTSFGCRPPTGRGCA